MVFISYSKPIEHIQDEAEMEALTRCHCIAGVNEANYMRNKGFNNGSSLVHHKEAEFG